MRRQKYKKQQAEKEHTSNNSFSIHHMIRYILINGKAMNKRLYPFINIYLLYRCSFLRLISTPNRKQIY